MNRRKFIQSSVFLAIGSGLLSATTPIMGAGYLRLDAKAIRLNPNSVRINWVQKDQTISVFAGADPTLDAKNMRLLASNANGGSVDVALPIAPRPYLLLMTSDGATLRLAERILPLAGGRNFRDLGGYQAKDGRYVQWGSLYRSGLMGDLTDPDIGYLNSLGIRLVCDLRSEQERRAVPTKMSPSENLEIKSFNYEMGAMMRQLFAARNRQQAINIFASAYVEMTDFLAPNYTHMFENLITLRAPLAVNCTAGKDRTGVAAALILSALGVSRDDVIADYALSEQYVPASFYLSQIRTPQAGSESGMSDQERKFMGQLPDDVLLVIMGSEPAVMEQALARIDKDFGGPINLIKQKFGVSDQGIAIMRQYYLA